MMDVLKKTLEMLEQERLYAEDCKDVLIPALDAEDEDVLVQVLQFTSQLYSDRDVVLRHCELVKDDAQSEEVRAAAAIALGPAFEVYGFCDWEDPFIEPAVSQEEFEEIMEEFRRLYENEATPKKVRRKVLEAVVRANEDWVPQAVREAWERDDPKWKRTAVFGAGYTRGCRSVVMEGLESENEDILREAL